VPVSAGLLHDVKDYDNALTAYRRGELRPIITAFARAAGYAVVNGRQLGRELRVSPPTAFRALDALVERGVLKAANSQRCNRIWLAEPVLNALDDFAARAGRRRLAQQSNWATGQLGNWATGQLPLSYSPRSCGTTPFSI
jgi:hypothetical protein